MPAAGFAEDDEADELEALDAFDVLAVEDDPLVVAWALALLEPELDTELVFAALEEEPVDAGEAEPELVEVGFNEAVAEAVAVTDAVVLTAALEVTQAQTASAEAWTARPVVAPHAERTHS